MTWENIATIIVSLVTTGGLMYSAWATHKSNKANVESQSDAKKIENDFRLIEEMRKELVRLYARLAEKDAENQRLEGIIDGLEAEADKHSDELKNALERIETLNKEKEMLRRKIKGLEDKIKEMKEVK